MPSLRKDGVALFYKEANGEGGAYCLVRGWCCDHTDLKPQFDHFAALPWRCLTG